MIRHLAVACLAVSTLATATASAQVEPGDTFGVSLLALTPNVTDDPNQALLDTIVTFGETNNYVTPFGTPLTFTSGQFETGSLQTTFLDLSTTSDSLLPAGSTFTASNGSPTEAADFLAFAAGTNIANGVLDGIDLTAGIVPDSLGIEAFLTIGGQTFGPFAGGVDDNTDNPLAGYTTVNGGPEIEGEIFIFEETGDISMSGLSAVRLEISYLLIPEPGTLSLLAVSGLTLLRPRRSDRVIF